MSKKLTHEPFLSPATTSPHTTVMGCAKDEKQLVASRSLAYLADVVVPSLLGGNVQNHHTAPRS